MARLTPASELEALAALFRQQARRLEEVREHLTRDVAATEQHWAGYVADGFRRHTGPQRRQRHLEVAAHRLRQVARAAEAAAEQSRQARTRREAAGQNSGGGDG